MKRCNTSVFYDCAKNTLYFQVRGRALNWHKRLERTNRTQKKTAGCTDRKPSLYAQVVHT